MEKRQTQKLFVRDGSSLLQRNGVVPPKLALGREQVAGSLYDLRCAWEDSYVFE